MGGKQSGGFLVSEESKAIKESKILANHPRDYIAVIKNDYKEKIYNIEIYSAATQMLVATLKGHTWTVNGVAFSRDGRQVISGSEDGTARLWDTANGSCLKIFGYRPDSFSRDSIHCVAFSTDGRQVVSGGKTTVNLWDVASGHCTHITHGHDAGWINCV